MPGGRLPSIIAAKMRNAKLMLLRVLTLPFPSGGNMRRLFPSSCRRRPKAQPVRPEKANGSIDTLRKPQILWASCCSVHKHFGHLALPPPRGEPIPAPHRMLRSAP
jgi:hypothetical protein